MARTHFMLVVAVCLMVGILLLTERAEGGYRKPPLNGSIFGKRGDGVASSSGVFSSKGE